MSDAFINIIEEANDYAEMINEELELNELERTSIECYIDGLGNRCEELLSSLKAYLHNNGFPRGVSSNEQAQWIDNGETRTKTLCEDALRLIDFMHELQEELLASRR